LLWKRRLQDFPDYSPDGQSSVRRFALESNSKLRRLTAIAMRASSEITNQGSNRRRKRIGKSRIAIIADNNVFQWGGSEELWSQTAIRLIAEGVPVAASVQGRFPLHDKVRHLMGSGVQLRFRPERYSLLKRVHRRALTRWGSDLQNEISRFLHLVQPEIVIFSTGAIFPPIEWLELCREKGLPFVTIGQVNCEYSWYDDETAARYRQVLRAARRCYFVSKANLRLAEKQIGLEFSNAEVVRNPFNVDFSASPPWPSPGASGVLHLACVGRLDLGAKGQDVLLEALAGSVWMNRPWRLALYGNGPLKNIIERLIERFGFNGRVTLAGYVSRVEDIWAENHVLVMPSRSEGMPLAMVEAMLCGRLVVTTDVAGQSEIVEDGVSGFLANAPTVASVAGALERLWERRHDVEAMGQAAAKRIRNCVPVDPASVFSEKIKSLLTAPAEGGHGICGDKRIQLGMHRPR
jgi:glycosyltransferase involved in cell wall biosynthesis